MQKVGHNQDSLMRNTNYAPYVSTMDHGNFSLEFP